MDAMLVEVTVLPRGSSAIQAEGVGASTVTVEDPTDFASAVDLTDANDETIGALDICGVRYDFLAVDVTTGVITLASPLTVDVSESDPVSIVVGDQVAQDWTAVIDPGEGDNQEVPLPYAMRALLPEGQYDPPVPVVVADDYSTVLDAPGRQPVLSAEVAAPLTEAIENAQASADGKNKIFYDATEPTGANERDTWFDAGNNNRVNRWDGSAWVPEQFGENALADLSITNAKIADATIDSAKIANLDAGKITTGILSAITLTGNTITGGTITGAMFRTAVSGPRIQMDSANYNQIKFYTGDPNETGPGSITTQIGGYLPGNLYATFASPKVSGVPQSSLELSVLPNGASYAYLAAQVLTISSANGLNQLSVYNTGGISIDSSVGGQNTNVYAASEFHTLSAAFYVRTGNNATDALRVEAGGNVVIPRHGTTTSAASVFMGTGGTFFRVTSRRDTKLDIDTFDPTRLKGLLGLDVRTWIDRRAAEDYAAFLSGETLGEGAKYTDGPLLTRIPGLVAEEVEETGLKEFVTYDASGEIQGLAYDRIGVAWIPLVRELFNRIETLERGPAA